jgi:hypothetical protein
MSSSENLTGRWTGHYLQHGQEYVITADLLHTGEQLSGSMHDGHPDREYSLFELAQNAGLPPGADEQIELQLRQSVPDVAAGPIRYVMHLPSGSALEGRCKGKIVYFLKTYQGTSFSGFKAGDRLLGVHKEGHDVHYEGRLSEDGLEIDGRWWIDANREQGTHRAEGLFSLRRPIEV